MGVERRSVGVGGIVEVCGSEAGWEGVLGKEPRGVEGVLDGADGCGGGNQACFWAPVSPSNRPCNPWGKKSY